MAARKKATKKKAAKKKTSRKKRSNHRPTVRASSGDRAGRKKPARKRAPARKKKAARKKARRKAGDPVTQYAMDVLDGRIIANRLVKLACERHLRDLKTGPKRGLYWHPDKARHAIDFFPTLCRHSKGRWAGLPVELSPWQQFIIGSLFGWLLESGLRRFRNAFVTIARKNGKSTKAAGLGLKLLVADYEPGAEVYAAATKRDQAKIVWGEAKRMVRRSVGLAKRIQCRTGALLIESAAAAFVPLGADADTMDGLNPHGVIIDELHAHKNRDVVDVLETATGAREHPLQFEITTAGVDLHSVCRERWDYSVQVLEGIVEDDEQFAYIATLDDDDDWRDPKVWVKANPNLGVSLDPDEMKKACAKAVKVPARQNAFRRLRCNQWTEQENRWLSLEDWDRNNGPVDPQRLTGRECYAGLDLSKTTDLSALVLVFPPTTKTEKWAVLPFFWVPEDSIMERSQNDRVPYDVWVREGLIEATPGNVVDYDFIEARALEIAAQFDVVEMPFDRMFANEITNHLQAEGITMVEFGQGFLSMAGPTAELERMVLGREIAHGGHPVLRWMASNVTVRRDPAGNLKPDKAKSREKIDGIVALIMAVGRAIVREEKKPSVYETRGIRTL